MAKREVEGFVQVKHSKFDKVDNRYEYSLFCRMLDKDRKEFSSDNLNFKLNPEQNQKFLKMLGHDELNGFTPLYVKIYRPEDETQIDEWGELTEIKNEDKDNQKKL